MKNPSYISSPSASSERACSIQSKTDIVAIAGDLVDVALGKGCDSEGHWHGFSTVLETAVPAARSGILSAKSTTDRTLFAFVCPVFPATGGIFFAVIVRRRDKFSIDKTTGVDQMAQKSDFRQTHPGSSQEEYRPSASGTSGNHSRGETNRERGRAAGQLADGEEYATHAVGRVVDRNPYASMLTGVAVGFGFGLALTLLLPRRQPKWYE